MTFIDYQTFASKLKSDGYTVQKLDCVYPIQDTRCWTAVVNPGEENLIVTFIINRYNIGNHYFDILSSSRSITDIYSSDIYDVLDSILKKPLPESTYFNTDV